jgi:hypothetical protein
MYKIFRIAAIVMGTFGASIWLLSKQPIADRGGMVFLLSCLIYLLAQPLTEY